MYKRGAHVGIRLSDVIDRQLRIKLYNLRLPRQEQNQLFALDSELRDQIEKSDEYQIAAKTMVFGRLITDVFNIETLSGWRQYGCILLDEEVEVPKVKIRAKFAPLLSFPLTRNEWQDKCAIIVPDNMRHRVHVACKASMKIVDDTKDISGFIDWKQRFPGMSLPQFHDELVTVPHIHIEPHFRSKSTGLTSPYAKYSAGYGPRSH